MILLPGLVKRDIGRRFRILRLREGWSQAELARRADVSLITPHRVEAGENVTIDSLLKIAATLGALGGFEQVGAEARVVDNVDTLIEPSRKRARRRARGTNQ